MEDILASIRRILDDENDHSPGEAGDIGTAADPVLQLDSSMMVPDPDSRPVPMPQSLRPAADTAAHPGAARTDAEGLVAPAAAAAAAQSVGSLVQTLATDRATRIHAGGPTLEDIVREEMRPLLKHWLDTNLPPLVERLVRAEIERVVGRAVP